jgi:hypothetical protein
MRKVALQAYVTTAGGAEDCQRVANKLVQVVVACETEASPRAASGRVALRADVGLLVANGRDWRVDETAIAGNTGAVARVRLGLAARGTVAAANNGAENGQRVVNKLLQVVVAREASASRLATRRRIALRNGAGLLVADSRRGGIDEIASAGDVRAVARVRLGLAACRGLLGTRVVRTTAVHPQSRAANIHHNRRGGRGLSAGCQQASPGCSRM